MLLYPLLADRWPAATARAQSALSRGTGNPKSSIQAPRRPPPHPVLPSLNCLAPPPGRSPAGPHAPVCPVSALGSPGEPFLDVFYFLTITILLRVRIAGNITTVRVAAGKHTGRSDRQEAIRGQAGGQHHRIDIQMLFPGPGFLVDWIQPEGLDIFDQWQMPHQDPYSFM